MKNINTFLNHFSKTNFFFSILNNIFNSYFKYNLQDEENFNVAYVVT